MKVLKFVLSLGMMVCSIPALAYDVETHRELTRNAFDHSNVTPSSNFWRSVGIPSTVLLPNSEPNLKIPREITADGAVLEDNGKRPLNHFFNPATAEGLMVGIVPFGIESPRWALEYQGSIASPLYGTQDFSYRDARQYFFDALTQTNKSVRDENWGLTFRTVGQVLHHLQDMAQPQHVRNDSHCGHDCAYLYPASAYEAYTKTHTPSSLMNPALVGYNIDAWEFRSTFTSALKFWKTEPPANVANGKGIAEFTHRNFLSAGTIKSQTFPLPVVSALPAEYYWYETPQGGGPNGSIAFYSSEVTDNSFSPPVVETNPRALAWSLFDADLKTKGLAPVYALNSFTFDAAHHFLIPRAVAFSAGMINYFFRGDIDVDKDPVSPSNLLIVNKGAEPMRGRFTIYYDDANDNRMPVPDANGVAIEWTTDAILGQGTALPAGNAMSVPQFPQPYSPAPKTPGEYLLVFNGTMGEETPATSGVGAVTAKVVHGERLGRLYVKVHMNGAGDATLRVGPDGTSVVGAGEFDPFAGVVTDGALGLSYIMKQVEFTTDAFGGPTYRMVAVAAGVYPQAGTGSPKSYAFNGAGTPSLINPDGLSWIAKSQDPALGTFSISVPTVPAIPNLLHFTRTYQENGQPVTVAGTFPKPPEAWEFPGHTAFDRVGTQRHFVSSDGLQVTTPDSVISAPAPDGSRTAQPLRYTLTLGTIPVATLVDNPEPYTSLQTTPFNVDEVIGTLVAVQPAGYCPQVPQALTSTSDSRHHKTGYTSAYTSSLRQAIEYQNGALRTYVSQAAQGVNDWDESWGAGVTFYACPDHWFGRTEYKYDQSNVQEWSFADVLTGGTVSGHTVNVLGPNQIETGPPYSGPLSALPPLFVADKGIVNSNSGGSVYRAFTPDPNDAIIATNSYVPNYAFRGIDITGKNIAADASPLGELFFATEDMSIVIHEPKGGSMPHIQLPPGVTKILAALWL